MKKLAIAMAVAGSAMATTQAQAAVTLDGSCGGAISVTGTSTVDSCIGWYGGNALNSNGNATINAALTALGYAGPTINYNGLPSGNVIAGLGGSQTVDFPGLLNGTVYIGLHFGGSAPGDAGNNTAFFRIDASNLDTIQINPVDAIGSSNAVLLAAVPTVAVPEPTTWALMLLGFAGIGLAMRRRPRHAAVRHHFA